MSWAATLVLHDFTFQFASFQQLKGIQMLRKTILLLWGFDWQQTLERNAWLPASTMGSALSEPLQVLSSELCGNKRGRGE